MYQKILESLHNQQNITMISKICEDKIERTFTNEKCEIDVQINDNLITLKEPFIPKGRLIIIGGGHVALPLCEFASKTDFLVTVLDDRAEFVTKERFPLAEKLICKPFEEGIADVKIGKYDYIVIVTRGHIFDRECLCKVLDGEKPFYIGMIGSKRKVNAVMEQMMKDGYSKEQLDGICSPIGLEIGAVSPEEIAISIMAEIIQYKRADKNADNDYEVIKNLAICEPKAIATIIKSTGATPRKSGAKMVIYKDGRTIGSVGGGLAEAITIEKGINLIETKNHIIEQISMNAKTAADQGMVCGGEIMILIEDYVCK